MTRFHRLNQVQRYYPHHSIALRERSDRSPFPTDNTEILIVEVDIDSTQAPGPLWAKHDGVSTFTHDLVEGDLEVYGVDHPFPGSLPFASVTSLTRVAQTEKEVVRRKMRIKVDSFRSMLNGIGLTGWVSCALGTFSSVRPAMSKADSIRAFSMP